MSNSLKASQNRLSKKPTLLVQQQTLKPASKIILENIDNKIKFSVFNLKWFQIKKYIWNSYHHMFMQKSKMSCLEYFFIGKDRLS